MEKRDCLVRFRERVIQENDRQNLTRLLSPVDFYEGHVMDCRALLESGWKSQRMLDLGSGVGVPGLLMAILEESTQWVLAESEGHKAEFLKQCVRDLGLEERVMVFHGRGEAYLKRNPIDCVVARAVGPILRMYTWLKDCSTWNNLILFKGPGWQVEWKEFEQSRYRRDLEITERKDYLVGADQKKRLLVKIRHVPRGTL